MLSFTLVEDEMQFVQPSIPKSGEIEIQENFRLNQPNSIFNENFEILKNIASKENYMDVFLVNWKFDNKEYVVKRIQCKENDIQMKEEIYNEVKIVSKGLVHSNIVNYKQYWTETSYENNRQMFNMFILMEACTEMNFLDYCKEDNLLNLLNKAIILTETIEFLSKNNIIHRDLKPDNIFIDQNGNPKIGDFGISYFCDNEKLIEKSTPKYKPIEQDNSNKLCFKSDIYSLGIIFMDMFCKFESCMSFANTISDLKSNINNSKLTNYLPSELIHLIMTMIQDDLNCRPNASNVLETLRELLIIL